MHVGKGKKIVFLFELSRYSLVRRIVENQVCRKSMDYSMMVVAAVVVAVESEVEEVHNSDNYYTSVVEVMDTYWKNCYRWVHRIGSLVVEVVVDCTWIVEMKETYSNHCYHWACSFHSYKIVVEAVVVVVDEEDIAEAYLIQVKEHDLWIKFLLILLVLIRIIPLDRLINEENQYLTKNSRTIVSSKCLMLNLQR